MLWRWIMALLLTLTICPAVLVGTSRGQSVQVTVGQTSVTLEMNLLLQENLTALPVFNIEVTASNTSSVYDGALGPVNTAIKNLVPTASVSSLALHAKTMNSTRAWFLEENYSIIVTGASTITGSSDSADLSFIAMNLSQPIPILNQELNAVGSAYLLQPLTTISSQYSKLGYFINGHQTLSAVIPEQTTRTFWLLDFTWVPAVSTWTSQPDILGQSTTWTLSQTAPQYNLTMGVPSPEGTLLKSFIAIYNPSLSVTVPSNARINRNTISFDIPTSSELAMPVVAGVSLIVLVAATLFDGRITRTIRIRKKKR
jgi:hypothetical protein